MYKTILIILFATILSCSKGKFIDKELSSYGWSLIKITDADDNIILERPDNFNSEIYLVFTTDHRVIGHTPTFTISGTYEIENNKNFSINNLELNTSNLCCEWEEYFITNYKSINKYNVHEGGNLILYFNANKMIFNQYETI